MITLCIQSAIQLVSSICSRNKKEIFIVSLFNELRIFYHRRRSLGWDKTFPLFLVPEGTLGSTLSLGRSVGLSVCRSVG